MAEEHFNGIQERASFTAEPLALPGGAGTTPEEVLVEDMISAVRAADLKAAKLLHRRFLKENLGSLPLLGEVLGVAAESGATDFVRWLVGSGHLFSAKRRGQADSWAGISEKERGDAFVRACQSGRVKTAALIHSLTPVSRAHAKRALEMCAGSGQNEAITWLGKTFGFGEQDAGAIAAAVGACCARGDVAAAQQLLDRFGESGVWSARVLLRYFAKACGEDHQQAAIWLAARMQLEGATAAPGITIAAMREGKCEALTKACCRGHTEVAMWLIATFGMSRLDIDLPKVLEACCVEGRLEMLIWLRDAFNLVPEDFAGDYLLNACFNGRSGVVHWLAESNLVPPDVDIHEAIDMAGSHPELATWLSERFGGDEDAQ